MEPNKNVLPGVFSLIKESIDFYKKNYKALISIQLVPFVFLIISAFVTNLAVFLIPKDAFSESNIAVPIFIFILALILSLVGFVIKQASFIALVKTISELSSNVVISVKDIYKWSFGIFISVIWVYILIVLCSLPFVILFLIPGIIISGYLSLAIYSVIVDGKRGLQSLESSFYYVKGNWQKLFWRNFGLGLIFVIICIVFVAIIQLIGFAVNNDISLNSIIKTAEFLDSNVLVSMLISYAFNAVYIFVLLPIIMIYGYLLFKYIKQSKPEPSIGDSAQGFKTKFKVIGIVGAVVLFLLILVIPVIFATISGYKKAAMRASMDKTDLPITEYVFPKDIVSLPMKLEFLQEEPYINKDLGFSINFPKNWVVDYNGEDVYSAIKIEGDSDANISVKKLSIPDYIYSNDELEFMELVANKIAHNENLKLRDVKYFLYNVNSYNMYQITGTVVDKEGTAKINYNYILNGADVYYIGQAAKESTWPSMEETFMNSLSTFKAI